MLTALANIGVLLQKIKYALLLRHTASRGHHLLLPALHAQLLLRQRTAYVS